jgi:tetratricopeptide (TPR) repeat protein
MSARYAMTVGRFATAACLLAVAGCATEDMQSGMRKMTPSFMLSDQEKAERNLKDPASLHVAYGKFQEQTGQPVEARKSYEAALHDDSQSTDAILGLARLDQLADKPKDAEAGFQKALHLKPGDGKCLASLGQFYVSQKRWPDAFEALNAAIAASPKDIFYKHELAVAKTTSGDVEAGLALFSQLVGPEKAHYNVAFLLKQQGKTQAAVQECQVALRINPTFEPAKVMLTQIRDQQLAESHPGAYGKAPAMTKASPIQTSLGSAPQIGAGVGTTNQPATSASQASWQPPPRPASSGLPSSGLPLTSGDSTFDTASAQPPAPPGQQPGTPAAGNDAWTNFSP